MTKGLWACQQSGFENERRRRQPTGKASFGRMTLRWILAFLLMVGALGARANDLSTTFEQANKLYEQGKYAEAVSAYEKLAQQKQVSAALYFNLGNALFKSGQIGRAILNYRLAERLNPRDPDIKANLQFARDSVSGGSRTPWGRWRRLLNTLSLDEITVIATAAGWVWFVLLILRQVRPAWSKSLRGYTATAGLATALAGLWLAGLLQERFQLKSAVIVVPEAVVRYGPLEESQSFYVLHDGAELKVTDHLNAWYQVQDGSKRIGWVQSKQVALLPPG